MHRIDKTRLLAFRNYLLDWYQTYGRHDLPWRQTNDPYRIMVSEMMLQQTQVPRVIPKYHAFLDQFPDIHSLAESELRDVITQWQGLGYNRRAKYLHTAARQVVDRFDGTMPHDEKQLLNLYGIGPYTASAIQAFAFDKPVIVVETNVRSVLIHHFFPGETEIGDSELRPLLATALPEDNARKWYSALMDYGTVLKSEIGNTNRRSSSYQKQSRFEGSKRQVRGSVLRELTNRDEGLSYDDLERSVDGDLAYLESVLQDLRAEEMITLEDSRYRL